MQKKPNLQRLSFSYPNSLKKELDNLAKNDFRKLPSLIKLILDNHLKTKENK